MILIGLTGGIACGKSTVSSILQKDFDITVIDADQIVHELQAPGGSCYAKIVRRWPQVVDPCNESSRGGVINRAKLGKIVFADAAERKTLGKIMNRAIFLAILKRIFYAWLEDWKRYIAGSDSSGGERARSHRIVVLDAPTLFETKMFLPLVSSTLVIACSEATQKDRLMRRPHPQRPGSLYSEEEATQRIRSQMPLEVKKRRAGYVLSNEADEEDLSVLREEVKRCVSWMSSQSSWRLNVLFGGVPLALAALLACSVVAVAKSYYY